MLKVLVPSVLLLIGSGVGIGAGLALRPTPDPTESGQAELNETAKQVVSEDPDPVMEYAKLNNQFVVPIVKDRKVVALVVMALSVEVPAGGKEVVFQHEPKLRDSFLQVLFDHANVGGFDGAFTSVENLAVLRRGLKEVAQKDLGEESVGDVLILEIARQDY